MTTSIDKASEVKDQRLADVLANITDLPTIPQALINILNVIDDPASGPSDLARAVRQDAPLMAKILRLANSPFYRPRGDIADINRCVTVLGYRTVQQVAISVSVASVLVKNPQGTNEAGHDELDCRELWHHSVVTGAIAKQLAKIAGLENPEELFTAGLLHDMGKFIMELHAPGHYARLIPESLAGPASLTELELEKFGFEHAQLAAAFAQSWRFPDVLVRPLAAHHDSPAPDPKQPFGQEAAIVALADYLANTIEPPKVNLGFDPTRVNLPALYLACDITEAQVCSDMSAIRESVQLAAPYLQID
ncbi:MAG: putative nucleotidyltransferase with HDIG domain [Candidatus Krumholzibacteriia bacterium]